MKNGFLFIFASLFMITATLACGSSAPTEPPRETQPDIEVETGVEATPTRTPFPTFPTS